jgi:hypothetical protein
MKKFFTLLILSVFTISAHRICATESSEQVTTKQKNSFVQLEKMAALGQPKNLTLSKKVCIALRWFMKNNLNGNFESFLTEQYGKGNEQKARAFIASDIIGRVKMLSGEEFVEHISELSMDQVEAGLRKANPGNKTANPVDLYLTGHIMASYSMPGKDSLDEEDEQNRQILMLYKESLEKIATENLAKGGFKAKYPDVSAEITAKTIKNNTQSEGAKGGVQGEQQGFENFVQYAVQYEKRRFLEDYRLKELDELLFSHEEKKGRHEGRGRRRHAVPTDSNELLREILEKKVHDRERIKEEEAEIDRIEAAIARVLKDDASVKNNQGKQRRSRFSQNGDVSDVTRSNGMRRLLPN